MIRAVLGAAVTVAVFAVAGCGGDESPRILGGPSSRTGTAPAVDPDALPTDWAQIRQTHTAVTVSSVAEGAEQEALVEAWHAFWQAVLDSRFAAKPVDGLDRRATGEALSQVETYVARLAAQKRHTVGWTKDHVQKIDLVQGEAGMTICAENQTVDVDESGEKLGSVAPWLLISALFRETEDGWAVHELRFDRPEKSCLE